MLNGNTKQKYTLRTSDNPKKIYNDTQNPYKNYKIENTNENSNENTKENTNENTIENSNKKVKFNDKVDIIPVESYKEYNKSDEDYENKILEYFKKNYNDYNNNSSISHSTEQKRNNKKFCNCTCFIL